MYEFFQSAVSRKEHKELFRNEILKPDLLLKVLDFGCGTGYHSQLFKSGDYLGIEPLESCIAMANRKYSSYDTKFQLGNHTALKSLPADSFDLVFAIGVLHHIDNKIFSEFAQEAFRLLKPGARLTTFDPVFHSEQSKCSEWVVKQDRGKWVRTDSEYTDVIGSVFPGTIETKIYSKLLRIPYDHIVINAFKNLSD